MTVSLRGLRDLREPGPFSVAGKGSADVRPGGIEPNWSTDAEDQDPDLRERTRRANYAKPPTPINQNAAPA